MKYPENKIRYTIFKFAEVDESLLFMQNMYTRFNIFKMETFIDFEKGKRGVALRNFLMGRMSSSEYHANRAVSYNVKVFHVEDEVPAEFVEEAMKDNCASYLVCEDTTIDPETRPCIKIMARIKPESVDSLREIIRGFGVNIFSFSIKRKKDIVTLEVKASYAIKEELEPKMKELSSRIELFYTTKDNVSLFTEPLRGYYDQNISGIQE
jgi:hypothetical protein